MNRSLPRPLVFILVAMLASVALSACSTPAATPDAEKPAVPEATRKVLTGSVVYRERVELPADARIKVQLVDAVPGKPATVMAETEFGSSGRQVPVPFSLPIDAAKLKGGHGYALRAYIAYGGQTRYVTSGRVTLDPDAFPATVSILVVPGEADPQVADSPAPPGAIRAAKPPPRQQGPGNRAPAPPR